MRQSRSLLFALLVGALTACAAQTPGQGTPPSPQVQAPQSPEEALRARATQFWEARVKGDLGTQYDLLEPKARERVTLTGFVRLRSSVIYQSYTIEGVEVAGDEGQVIAKTTFRISLPHISRFGPWDQPATTRWVRVEGDWFIRYEQDAGQPLKAGERQP